MGSPPQEWSGVFQDLETHSSAQRVSTEVAVISSLRTHHRGMIVTPVSSHSCNLWAFAKAGHAKYAPDTNAPSFLTSREYQRPPGRLNLREGSFAKQDIAARYKYIWHDHTFVVYNAEISKPYQLDQVVSFVLIKAKDGESVYSHSAITDQLVKAVSHWTAESHNEIWIFDDGRWQKSEELFDAVQGADWKDVILDDDMKKMLIKDVEGFFDAQETYKKFGVPWKRGIILHGQPGNGKTISIKAIMKSLASGLDPVPSLYVKSFVGCNGPQHAIMQIFRKARESSPCFLVFEDLDCLVTDALRSYFLNEVDGLQSNNGILILGSTNHLDKLDPAIVKRPSRFDRKYPFYPPIESQRAQYAEYWRNKLETVPEVTMSASDCAPIASRTEGFTFAYLKEAFIATLFHLFSHQEEAHADSDEDGRSAFLRAFEVQVEMLEEQMNDEKDAEANGKSRVNIEADAGPSSRVVFARRHRRQQQGVVVD